MRCCFSPIGVNKLLIRKVNVAISPTVLPVVAATLIDDGGRVLLQKRPENRMHGGLWEFPGGKVEPCEKAADALARELEEELGITLDPGAIAPVGFADAPLEPRNLILLLYACTAWEGAPHPREEGAAIGWFAPATVAELDLAPADRQLLPALIRFLESL